MKAPEVTFSWRNYLKPTPRLFLIIAEYLKGLFVLITSMAAWEAIHTQNPWYVVASSVVGYSLDQLIKLFAHADAEAHRVITVDVPEDTEVKITDEIKPGPPSDPPTPD